MKFLKTLFLSRKANTNNPFHYSDYEMAKAERQGVSRQFLEWEWNTVEKRYAHN